MIWLILAFLSLDIGNLQKADLLYKKGQYAEALQLYQNEQKERPDDPLLAFNIGNTLMKLGRQDEAVRQYQLSESLTRSAPVAGKSAYNRALANMKQQEMEKALLDARQAVKLNPADPDARANAEVISRLIDLRQQQQKQQQNKDDKKDQNKQDQQKQEQQKQDQQKNDQKKQDQQKPDQQQQQATMPKEQAQRLLDALKKNEQEALLKKKEMQTRQRRKTDKDW
ncbi:MAG: tetratricopeptide repeat protein [Bacteroidetes bacterium]|nr:tetratricopeptide repeat protein [Bacteroidota bacterium]